MAAELAEGEGGTTAQVIGHVEAARHSEVSPAAALTGLPDPAEAQRLACGHRDRLAHADRYAVDARRDGCAAHRDARIASKAQARASDGDLERRGALVVADEPVGQAQGERVHRPGRRHTHVPEAEASRPVLHRGLHARRDDVDGAAGGAERGQAAGGVRAGGEGLESHRMPQVVEVRLEPVDLTRFQRDRQLADRIGAVAAVGDQFGEHRVVVRGDLGAALDPGVHTQIRRKARPREHAGRRLEVLERIFRVHPCLHGMAGGGDRQAVERRHLARAELHHPLDDVDAGDGFGHAVLDLQPGVDFEEIEVLSARVDDELDRARRAVTRCRGEALCGVVKRHPHLGTKVRRRGFLDHLLVAPLQRAVPVTQREHATAAVAEDLHLDVARIADVALEEHTGVGEVRLREALDRLERSAQIIGASAHLHADAAATRAALEHHRVADAFSVAEGLVEAREQAGSGTQRHAAVDGQRARGVLQAEEAHLVGRWAEEDQARGFDGLDEAGVLGQESVARMDRLRPGGERRVDDALAVEVALRNRRRSDAHRGVGHGDVHRPGIGLGVDGDRTHAHAAQGADDAARDGAAVGDQDLVEHGVLRPGPRPGSAPAWGCSRCTGC